VTPGGLEALVREGLPSVDEKEVGAWARMFRYGASPGSYEALDRMNMAIDVRDVLPLVSAPTLVLRQRADPEVRAEHGHYLAQHIPGATYVELDGDTHLLTAAIVPQLLAQAVPFLQAAASQEAPEPEKTAYPAARSEATSSPRSVDRDLHRVRRGAVSCQHGGEFTQPGVVVADPPPRQLGPPRIDQRHIMVIAGPVDPAQDRSHRPPS
jgi:hypothetical protein